MHDYSPKSVEYKFLKPEPLESELLENSLWYLKGPVADLLNTYYYGQQVDEPDWKQTRKEVIALIQDCLACGDIALGSKPEFFNDETDGPMKILEKFCLLSHLTQIRSSSTTRLLIQTHLWTI